MTQEQAFTIMKTGVNVYLTGSAGSGKTYLLNRYISYLHDHGVSVAVTASTGIAATHMNGMTIHGWSGIGIKETLDERDLQNLEDKKYLWKRFEKARVLIIDEVSMLHSYRLDMIDKVCRRFKRNNKPFGGLQVILSGDFFQLPPINKNSSSDGKASDNDSKNMIFTSVAWEEMCPAICYLTEQHRQEDNKMIEILNSIRSNSIKDKHLNYLRERIGAKLPDNQKPTRLYTHNVNVDNENIKELLGIEGEEKFYKMTSTGGEVLVEILKKSCLAHQDLTLKIGAEVMFIKNNLESGYVNGTRGIVENFSYSGNPMVRLHNGKSIEVNTETWAIEEDGKKKASITQIPLRLAWAITIHKSQGMSLDNALIDLSHTFSYGMGYVALSRVRTLAGVSLIGLHEDALKIDPDVSKFDEFLQKQSEENENLFGKLKKEEKEKMANEFLLRVGGTIFATPRNRAGSSKYKRVTDTKIPTIMITKDLLDQGKDIKEISKERNLTRGTITHHVEQIMAQYPKTKIYHIRPRQKDIDLVSKANKKLKGEEVGKLSPIKIILEKDGINMTFEDIRLAKLFI